MDLLGNLGSYAFFNNNKGWLRLKETNGPFSILIKEI